eukprot:7075620-Prymnesium_polylepis.1
MADSDLESDLDRLKKQDSLGTQLTKMTASLDETVKRMQISVLTNGYPDYSRQVKYFTKQKRDWSSPIPAVCCGPCFCPYSYDDSVDFIVGHARVESFCKAVDGIFDDLIKKNNRPPEAVFKVVSKVVTDDLPIYPVDSPDNDFVKKMISVEYGRKTLYQMQNKCALLVGIYQATSPDLASDQKAKKILLDVKAYAKE